MSTLVELEAAINTLPELEQQALFERLAQRLGERSPSCFDLVRDLFEKPGKLGASSLGDLSTNKEHIYGFGTSS